MHFNTANGAVHTEALLDTGAQINSVGEGTREGAEVMRNANGEHIEVCSPLGKCSKCIVGIGRGCIFCKNKKILFKEKFVVLPGSDDTPIVGIQAMRDMDLVGENIHLFRTAESLAKDMPPIASRGDQVTPHHRGDHTGHDSDGDEVV